MGPHHSIRKLHNVGSNGKRTDSRTILCCRSEVAPLVSKSLEFPPVALCVNKSTKELKIESITD